ncbi:MAG: aminotransferase class V-fold PLP-dependent enzyme [Bacteroidetes bacterium]|nr:aminotransferase class V-fold PLP-dependent enzyme [Bacteroidota bacterium]
MTQTYRFPSEYSHLWAIEPGTIYLNHGSFGACTKYILNKQQEYRNMLESQPMRFMVRQLEEMIHAAREKVAAFVNSDPDDLVFIQNATAGVNTVFKSLHFEPGDEILITNHTYFACRKLLEYIAEATGAILIEATYDIPVSSPGLITEAVLSAVSPKTKIALIDHITSATALIQPVKEIVRELEKRGVDTMVDGAHVPGSIPLDIESIGAAYYTANCHKWLCSPKSAAILHVRKDKQKQILPLIISHAGHKAEPFAERFFWQGTLDPSPILCVTDSIDYMASLMPGGWDAIMKRNHEVCIQARDLFCSEMGLLPSCPEEMNAGMSTIELPDLGEMKPPDYKNCDAIQNEIYLKYSLELPLWYWSQPPRRITRLSVQLYNSPEQFSYAVRMLKQYYRPG